MKHRTYLALAIPLTISTITTPLLGVVDMAVVGQLANPAYIGGVAVGTVIFNTLYWLFGFLRVSTSGFAAQAEGANDVKQQILALIRPLYIALIVGMVFLILQLPILKATLALMSLDSNVLQFATEYYSIRIWGAPFALANYVVMGWLVGKARIKLTVSLQILMNLINIILAIVFVKVFSWGVSGVAAATLIAEIATVILSMLIVIRLLPQSFRFPSYKEILDPKPFKKMVAMNRDLMMRTFCLLVVFNLFTAKGAEFGTEVLAANAVLIQIHYMMAYTFDGFANASSIYVGKAIGSQDENLYKKTVSLSIQWAFISSLFITFVFYLCKGFIMPLFSKTQSVLELTATYELWILLFPITACLGLVLYGVFTGATEAKPIRNSMIYALGVFLLILLVSLPTLHNHGLWLSFIVFSLGRSIFLTMYLPALNYKLFPSVQEQKKASKTF
ncbi:MATE family efflux transporter [Ureibacillus sinduriensis]|uniref:Damage-inducible protein F n=1 Tax=Ureibacillus sinduriensis BLB-1 = JCM 15800 TaxID=1384057 RepID=A0A0A3HP27_9BACL|nr:MATE family efflux transporter [Ureibacillus sinduriensis]KGR74276.1 damage-inducible protein F [Ureibacillus sinduriensis BLB-1 = JCM 15800]